MTILDNSKKLIKARIREVMKIRKTMMMKQMSLENGEKWLKTRML